MIEPTFATLRPAVSALGLLALLAACDLPGAGSSDAPTGAPRIIETAQDAPPGAAPGTCWAKTETPALVQTVTEQVLVRPAEVSPEGLIRKPPVYRSETRQEIVTQRQVNWIETLCPTVLTAEFVASLQRAMAARGLYGGPITGQLDDTTRAAIQGFQAQGGIAIATPTLATAQRLGLAVTPQSG